MKEECLQRCLQMRRLALPCHSSLALKLKAGSFSEIKVVREAAEFWGASWDMLLAVSACPAEKRSHLGLSTFVFYICECCISQLTLLWGLAHQLDMKQALKYELITCTVLGLRVLLVCNACCESPG